MDIEGVMAIGGFFSTVIVLAIGVPLMRSYIRRRDRLDSLPAASPEVMQRLERMEQAIDSIAVEVERISEGQRFTTKLLSERVDTEKKLNG